MSAAPRRRQRKSAEQRRAEIVDAVLALAYEKGPDSITAAAIAERVGFAQPAVFRHFSSMAEVWLAVADSVGARTRRAWLAADDPALDAEARLRRVLAAHVGVVEDNPGLPAIIFSRELQVHNKPLRQRFRAHMEAFVDRLTGVIADGVTAGSVNPGVDPATAARAIIGLLQGTAFRWALSEQSFDLRAECMAAFGALWDGLEA